MCTRVRYYFVCAKCGAPIRARNEFEVCTLADDGQDCKDDQVTREEDVDEECKACGANSYY
ncbi:hypothetical protein OC845_003067 [Tilletia horrida]|nr:hypothetical protein OC845_003067 [Tilletia horrida]